MSSPERGVKRRRITPKLGDVDPDLLGAPRDDDSAAQGTPQDIERLVQRVAGPLLARLGPKYAQQGVAVMNASRLGEGEVGEEGDALGSREHRTELAPVVRIAEVERTQRAEFDHGNGPSVGALESHRWGDRTVTSEHHIASPPGGRNYDWVQNGATAGRTERRKDGT